MAGERIEAIYAVLADNPDGEGIVAFRDADSGSWLPLVHTNLRQPDVIRASAQELATGSGKTFRLVRFERRVDVEEIQP
jgi:hypothetical protein